MSYVLGTHVSAANSAIFTTPSIVTTGADLIVLAQSWLTTGGIVLPTDSKSNVYTPLATINGSRHSLRLLYKQAPAVGTGHNWTQNDTIGSGGHGGLCAAAFTGSIATPLDLESEFAQAAAGHTTIQPGSITPGASAELLIAAWGLDDPTNTTWAIDSGFTIIETQDVSPGNWFGCVLAYKIKTDAAAENPTFTRSATNTSGGDTAAIAAFKVAFAGSPDIPPDRAHSALHQALIAQ